VTKERKGMAIYPNMDCEITRKENDIYVLIVKGTLVLEGTFNECVAEYEKRLEMEELPYAY
jgi:hypothetical protein